MDEMDSFDVIDLDIGYDGKKRPKQFYESSEDSLSDDDSNDSNTGSGSSEKHKGVNDDVDNDEQNKVEKYIKLENTVKIWAGTNEIINYGEKEMLEFDKIIFPFDKKDIIVSSNSKSINISNNDLENLHFLESLLQHISKQKNIEPLNNYSNISSLDISFNKITTINDQLFLLTNLKTLYLHSNKINDLNEIQKLTSLTKLRRLTLENNPIMELYNKFYRSLVIHYLPQIKWLDFHTISKVEKNKASISFNTHKYKFNLS